MKKRITKTLHPILNRDQAENVMNHLAEAKNDERTLCARRDAEVLAINARYEVPLARCAEEINLHTARLQAWAEANPDQFPKERKSLKLLAGRLGFNTNPPKVALLNRTWSWEKVLEALKARSFAFFVRTKEEVDKDELLRHYSTAKSQGEKEEIDSIFAGVGVKVIQDEQFFIEPDLTPFESRTTTKA
jgi:phage host-nuclease inhibitor protein Gam